MDWWRTSLAGKCASVRATPRLEQHPCVVTVEEMAAARHFVKTQFSQVGDSFIQYAYEAWIRSMLMKLE